MTSNDAQQYLTVEMFNSKMETFLTQIRLENEKLRSELKTDIQGIHSELHNEIQSVRSDLHAEILAVHSDVKVNSAQIAELHHFMYWGFAIITIVAAVVPFLRRERKEKTQNENQAVLTEQKVQSMIDAAISQAVNNAVSKALGVYGK